MLFWQIEAYWIAPYPINAHGGFMPRKTLDMSRECGRLSAKANKQAPRGLGGWLLCLTPALPRGSCQEYRGINRRLFFSNDDFYADMLEGFRINRKAPIVIGTCS